MTGKWVWRAADDPAPPHSRARLDLDDGHALHYLDPRQLALLRGTPEALLRSLCEPSHEIADTYRSHTFALDSGRLVTGMIVAETPTAITVMEDPLARCEPTLIEKDTIEDRKASPVSIMPKGLLNRLSREEILDLVAYLVANGDARNPIYAPR